VVVGYSREENPLGDGPGSQFYWLYDAMGYLMTMAAGRVPVVECWVVTDAQFGHFRVDGECVRDGAGIYSSGFPEVLHRIALNEPEAYADYLGVSLEEVHAAVEGILEKRAGAGHREDWPTIEVCQEHAHPIERLGQTAVAAHMVFEGCRTDRSRESLGKIAPAAQDSRAQVREAYEQSLVEQTTEKGFDWHDEALEIWLNAIHPVKPVPLSLSQAGILTCALERIPVRDAVLISFTSLGAHGAREFLAQYVDANPEQRKVDGIARRAIGEITDPSIARRPDIEHTEAVRKVLSELVSLTPPERHTPARTLLALLAWWQGNLTLAQRHLEEAGLHPGTYGLADLIASAVDAGLAPGWCRQQNVA
jgi:hypothetical protein